MKIDKISNFFTDIWVYVLKYSRASHIFSYILGKNLHKKLVIAPQLGYWPNIKNPTTFNEKIAHRTIHTDRKLFSVLADKYRVREYVRETVGSKYLNKVYYVTEKPEDLLFSKFPQEYVIKATHGSGWNIFVNNNSKTNNSTIIHQCKSWLTKTYGEESYEYWYESIRPRILVEKMLKGDGDNPPRDYKFFVFHGQVKYIQLDFDRNSNHTRRFFDENWNPLDFTKGKPLGPIVDKPDQFEEMKTVAEELSGGLGFARIDLYNTSQEGIIFGEITLAPGAGRSKFESKNVDYIFGSHWDLTESDENIDYKFKKYCL